MRVDEARGHAGLIAEPESHPKRFESSLHAPISSRLEWGYARLVVFLAPSLLDARGCLREAGALPTPQLGYLVFGQASPPPFDVGVLRAFASRFLEARVGLSAEKTGPVPPHDLAFVLVHRAHVKGTVPVEARVALDADRTLARAAEHGRGGGLADLAARCPRVFVVHEDDETSIPALLVACVLAGTSLGPIVPLDGSSIFGVKTGRERLEKRLAASP